MPILDLELVVAADADAPDAALTQALADAAGRALGSPPGRVWLRLRLLPAAHYAENGATVGLDELPAFATVLHARPPEGPARVAETTRLTQALAQVLGRPADRVHVQYAPAASGRQAFGGVLVP